MSAPSMKRPPTIAELPAVSSSIAIQKWDEEVAAAPGGAFIAKERPMVIT